MQLVSQCFMTSYVAGYAAGSDEHREVHFHLKEDNVQPEVFEMIQSKIKGSKSAEERRREKLNIKESMFRELPITDAVWCLIDLPYTASNFRSIYVDTNPFSCRGGYIKFKKNVYKFG